MERFSEWQVGAYRQVLAAYAQAERVGPRVELTVARCRFIEDFAYAEDVNWAEGAQADLDACHEELAARFVTDPEAELYRLEGEYGEGALARGAPLLEASAAWSPSQRARLHAELSWAYQATEQITKAGEHAVHAVGLDPGSNLLAQAIRHLGATGRADQVGALVDSAPLADYAWFAGDRIKALLEAGLPKLALREVERHREAGIEVDDKIVARVHLASGKPELAAAAFGLDKEPPPRESAEDRWLRFDIALAAGRFDIAAKALGAARGESDDFGALMGNYARLLHARPWAVWQSEVLVVTAIAVGSGLLLLLTPGLLLVPVHYRGLARRVCGKPATPLFAEIGLRHAWIAVAAFVLVPLVVAGIVAPDSLHVLFDGGGAVRSHGEGLARQMLWGSIVCLVILWPVWRRFSREEMFVSMASWKPAVGWAIAGWGVLVALSMLTASTGLQDSMTVTDQTRMVSTVAQGLDSRYGAWAVIGFLALLTPVLEELVFRGALLGGLTRHIGFGWANLLQALVFAAIHDDPPRFVFYLLMGLIAGWLTRRTGGLLAPVVLHGLNNALYVSMM